MTKMATVEDAVSIAAQAHKGQKDKADAPYLLHPLRLMLRMDSEAAMMAAVLHDVVEDTDWTIERLRGEGFSDEVLEAVECLTHRDGESYQDFVERVRTNPIARQVKVADLEDNMNIRRVSRLGAKDLERLEKYHRAWCVLTGAGNL
jgi:(p)ppGpp synthase/HD superfamily hydrolase